MREFFVKVRVLIASGSYDMLGDKCLLGYRICELNKSYYIKLRINGTKGTGSQIGSFMIFIFEP